MGVNESDYKKNRTVLRIFSIIDFITQSSNGCTISGISKNLGFPKTSVFDVVHTLSDLGVLNYDESTKLYSLGPELYRYGMRYLKDVELYRIVYPSLLQLSNLFGQTAYFAVPFHAQIMYMDMIESSSPLRTSCTIGETNTLYSTGLGKAILSAMSDDEIERLMNVEGRIVPKTYNTVKNYSELKNEIKMIRKRGFSIDDNEDTDGIYCIAAPLLNHMNQVVGAISISMVHSVAETKDMDKMSKVVCEEALRISKRMGYCKNVLYDAYLYVS